MGICAFALWFPLAADAARNPLASPIPNTIGANEPLNVSRTYRRGGRVEVRTAYIQQPGAAGDSRGFLGLKMKSDLGHYLPVVRAEIDYGAFDPDSSLALGNEDHRSVWVGAQSSWHGIQYGLSYQSMGQDFVPLGPVSATAAPGTNRTDIWGQRQFGNLGVRTFAWHARDVSDGDHAGVRLADTAVGTTLNYMLPSAPHIGATVSYSHQTTDSIDGAADRAVNGEVSHNLYGSLAVRKEYWNATASTSYVYKPDCAADDGGPDGIWTESIAASYTPHPNFSISPSLTYQDAPERGLRTRTTTRSAAVALQFRPAGTPYLLTASSTVAARSNDAWSMDAINHSTQAGIRMPLALGNPDTRNGSLAFRVNYIEARDAYASSDDLLLNLELTLHRFN